MEHKSNEGLTRQEKIEIGLIRPYSHTADRMVIEDIENGMTVEEIAQLYNRDVEDLKQHIEQIKGKVKSYVLRGNDEGFARLYAAIWAQAVKEEEKLQRFRLFCDVVEDVFGGLLHCYSWEQKNTPPKVERIIIERYGVAGTRAIKNIIKAINEYRKPLLSAVRQKICREEENWPDNPKGKTDKQYEGEYKKILADVLSASGGYLRAVSE